MPRWGFLETAMLDAIGEKRIGPGISQRWLTTFDMGPEIKREIKQLARVRHLLAHGLCGVEGRVGLSGEPGVRCRRANGSVIEIALNELETFAQHLDLLRLSVDRHHRGLGRPIRSND